jgi:phospholipase C
MPRRRLAALTIVFLLLAIIPVQAKTLTLVNSPLSKVQHIVVIMQENHSFDNYFALFPNANGISNYPQWAKNLSHPISSVSHDLCHSHTCMMKYYDNGKMDGWKDNEAFGYYRESDISYYWKLARNYTLLDNYFSDFMGPTLPNRIFSIAGDNFGITEDFQGHPEYFGKLNAKTIFDLLDEAKLTWSIYVPCAGCNMDPLAAFSNYNKYANNIHYTYDFIRHLKDGRLDNFTIIGFPDSFNEHPVSDVRTGMNEVENFVNAIRMSKFWKNTVIIITYDEAGGFYDHVPPPDSSYGFRVPTIIVSPLVKHGFISHKFSSHSSILAFTEHVFHLKCLLRDCVSSDLSESFPKSICVLAYGFDGSIVSLRLRKTCWSL